MGKHFTALQSAAADQLFAHRGAELDLCFIQSERQQIALAEATKLKLADNHFYFVLLGELYTRIDNSKAKQYFQNALALAKTPFEQQTIQMKIEAIV